MNANVFPSKVDAWLGGVLALAVAVQLAVIWYLFSIENPARWVTLPLLLLTPVLIIWALTSTRYVVSQDELVVRCGPLRQHIALAQITGIQPTRSALSSPALSLDRLLITYGRGQSCMISPRDAAGFCDVLRQHGVRAA